MEMIAESSSGRRVRGKAGAAGKATRGRRAVPSRPTPLGRWDGGVDDGWNEDREDAIERHRPRHRRALSATVDLMVLLFALGPTSGSRHAVDAPLPRRVVIATLGEWNAGSSLPSSRACSP